MARIVGLVFPEAAPAVEPAQEPSFVCPICGKQYKTEEGLEKHIKDKHTEAEQPNE